MDPYKQFLTPQASPLNLEYSFVVFDRNPKDEESRIVELHRAGMIVDDRERTLTVVERDTHGGFDELDDRIIAGLPIRFRISHPEANHLAELIHERSWTHFMLRTDSSDPKAYALSELFDVQTFARARGPELEVEVKWRRRQKIYETT
jgi:hypothetical protein